MRVFLWVFGCRRHSCKHQFAGPSAVGAILARGWKDEVKTGEERNTSRDTLCVCLFLCVFNTCECDCMSLCMYLCGRVCARVCVHER